MSGVRTTKDGMAQFLKSLADMSGHELLVGIFDEEQAAKAYVHELGSPANNIPARPFMVPGFESAQDEIADKLGGVAELTIGSGGSNAAAQAKRYLNEAGEIAVEAIRGAIEAGDFEPLKPATLAARRGAGNDSIQPLVDTGAMRDAITYMVDDEAQESEQGPQETGSAGLDEEAEEELAGLDELAELL
jgi:hypothetical protein